MVGMEMREQYGVYGLEAPALFFHGYLRPFAAVDQELTSAITDNQRRKPTIRERHHPAGSKKTDIEHFFSPSISVSDTTISHLAA
jgi:hypothetical protein